jgi:hypothetical protein
MLICLSSIKRNKEGAIELKSESGSEHEETKRAASTK